MSDNITIGDDVIAGGSAKIFSRVQAGRMVLGNPAVDMTTRLEMDRATRRLPRLAATVAKLQKTVTDLIEKA